MFEAGAQKRVGGRNVTGLAVELAVAIEERRQGLKVGEDGLANGERVHVFLEINGRAACAGSVTGADEFRPGACLGLPAPQGRSPVLGRTG